MTKDNEKDETTTPRGGGDVSGKSATPVPRGGGDVSGKSATEVPKGGGDVSGKGAHVDTDKEKSSEERSREIKQIPPSPVD